MTNIQATRGQEAKAMLDEIKSLYKTGILSYSIAKMLAFVPLEALNEEMDKIAKEFGRKHRIVSFTGFMR